MSWVTVVWSMIAAACLTLAGLHLLIWCRQRTAWGSVLFAISAAATAAMAGCELWMMRAETPGEWGLAGRWIHLPVYAMMLSLVGFVLVYLRAGRTWLAWLIVGVRTASLVLNFIFTPNLNFREVTGLQHIPFLGELVATPVGVPSPWMLIAQFSLVLMLVFVVDATISVWRRGDYRAAIQIGFNMIFFVLLASGQAVLAVWGFVHAPVVPSVFFLGIVAAMAYELSDEVLRAAQISRDLRESEQRMNLAVAAANFGIWIREFRGDRIWASAKWRELFGFTADEPLDLPRILERLHPEDRDVVDRAHMQARDGGGSYETEYRILLPDGRVRWISSHGRVEYDSQGQAVRIRGASRDFTARKLVEKALQESEARFRAMADTAPVMIWMAGTDKLCNFFNKSWLDFTGRTLDEELGDGWADGVHPEDFERCFQTYAGSFDARRTFSMDYRLRRADGEYRWVFDHGVPRFDPDGAFLGYIGSCLDITARRLAEEAAHDLSGRLISAQEEAHRQLARELHDDFSQRLALLSVELEMFGQHPPEDAPRITARMEDFSSEVKSLSSEVHRLSHALHPAKLDQLGLVAAVRGFCKEFGRAHELAIDFAERNVPRTVPGDAALCLYRTAQEALQNVVKHSGATAAKVELVRDDGHLRLVVADDGAGFDPQAVRTNSSLGLVSMGERARFVGGRLSVVSRPGAGARVEVRVPVASEEEPAT